MRKIILAAPPEGLTPEIVRQLTDEYKSTGNAVWRKNYIREALLRMTYSKCIYSEVKLNENSSYEEVDHFYPKSLYPDKVVEWGNLMPACKTCNTAKGDVDPAKEEIINPFVDVPGQYIRFVGIMCVAVERNQKGVNSIRRYNLNSQQFLRPRKTQIERNNAEIGRLHEELNESLDENSRLKRLIARLMTVMQSAQPEEPYSVCIAQALADNPLMSEVKKELQTKSLWSPELEALDLCIEQQRT